MLCYTEHEELDHFRQVAVLQDWCQASHLEFNVAKEKKRQPVTHPGGTLFLFVFEPNY